MVRAGEVEAPDWCWWCQWPTCGISRNVVKGGNAGHSGIGATLSHRYHCIAGQNGGAGIRQGKGFLGDGWTEEFSKAIARSPVSGSNHLGQSGRTVKVVSVNGSGGGQSGGTASGILVQSRDISLYWLKSNSTAVGLQVLAGRSVIRRQS